MLANRHDVGAGLAAHKQLASAPTRVAHSEARTSRPPRPIQFRPGAHFRTDGVLVVLRLGTSDVYGVGEVVGDYQWVDEFGDGDGVSSTSVESDGSGSARTGLSGSTPTGFYP